MYGIMGRQQDFSHPRWSEFYSDAFGLGEMATITKPIYYKNDTISYLLGVAGIDVPATQWLKLTNSLDEAKRRLKNHN